MVPTNGPDVKTRPSKEDVKRKRMERRQAAREEALRKRVNNDPVLIEFQPDAVEIEKRSVPGGARWTLYTVVALLIFSVAWSYWARVDKIVQSSGKLVTVVTPIVIQAPSSGAAPIDKMFAQFGDKVSVGDKLATLDSTLHRSDLTSVNERIHALDATIARLNAERLDKEFSIAGKEGDDDWLMEYQVFTERSNQKRSELQKFESDLNQLQVQVTSNDAEIKFQMGNEKMYKEVLAKSLKLYQKGHASEFEMLGRRVSVRETQTKLLTAKARLLELNSQMKSLDKSKSKFVAEWRSGVVSALVENVRQKNQLLTERKKLAKMIELSTIVVPPHEQYRDFEVLEVADRTVGSVLRPGDPLFRLVPLNVPMEAEVEISGRDIALIREGSEVRIKLDSYPFQRHGTLTGIVREIGEGSVEEERPTPNADGSLVKYKTRIALVEPATLENVGEHFRLVPGMNTTAEIKVGNRRVIQYFLYPLIRYWDTSIREP